MRAAAAVSLFTLVLGLPPAARAEEPASPPTVEDLERRIRKLEEKGTAEAGPGGFFVKSADGSWWLRVRGYVQVDGRFFDNEGVRPAVDTFELRRARPIVEAGRGDTVAVRLVPDFAEGKAIIQDAQVDVRLAGPVLLRAGKMKFPLVAERLQSDAETTFVELGPTSALTPNRDIGVLVLGDVAKLSWALGAFNGLVDGASGDLDTNDSKDAVVRAVWEPVKGLGLGLGASRGRQTGTETAPALPSLKTFAQQTFFAYRPEARADGDRVRIAPQAYWFRGRLGAMAEWVRSTQEVAVTGTAGELDHEAWQVQASWVAFGEGTISYRGVQPTGSRGAWELAARVGQVRLDEAAFPVFADLATQARRSTETALGVNWWVSRNLKAMASLVRTTFEGGAAAGADRPDERALFLRLQALF